MVIGKCGFLMHDSVSQLLGHSQVVLLFLVLNSSEDHVGGRYSSIIATNASQLDSLGMLIFCH